MATGWTRIIRSDALRGIGFLGAARIFGMVCGLGTTVVWARFMPADAFGEFKVITAAMAFVAGFCLLGTGQVAIMAASKNQDGAFALLLRHKVLANSLGSVALVCGAGYYAFSAAGSRTIAFGLLAAALLFPLYNASDIWMSWNNGKRRFSELALGNILLAILSLTAILTAAILAIKDVWFIVLIYLTVLAGLNVAMLARASAQCTNTDVDHSLFAYGRHATTAMTFGSLLSLDVIIFNHFYAPQQVAEYVIALQLPLQLKGMLSLLGQVAAPRLYAANSLTESWQDLRRPFWLLSIVLLGVGLAGFFALPTLTSWLFSARYEHAAEYGKWLWLALACTNPVTTFLGTALVATRRRVFLYGPNIGHPVFQTALYLALVPLGIGGMVFARIIASIGLAAFYIGAFVYLRARAVPAALSAEGNDAASKGAYESAADLSTIR